MPWSPADALSHTSQADTPAKARLWAAVANRVREATGDDVTAIRKANAAVRERPGYLAKGDRQRAKHRRESRLGAQAFRAARWI